MTDAALPRRIAELSLPGALVGGLAGGFAGLLASIGGQPPGWAAVTAVTLAAPLALFGAGYSLLLAAGKFRPGVFAPAALYWLIGFPLARLLHELLARALLVGRPALPDDPLAFLAFQALVSVGFAIGFIWMHERVMPRWLLRVRDHNPVARTVLARYLRIAEQMQGASQRKRDRGRRDSARARFSRHTDEKPRA